MKLTEESEKQAVNDFSQRAIKNSSKLNHGDLEGLAMLLGYKDLSQGICHGFSLMLLQAFLANDTDTFFKRLEIIESYKPADAGSNSWRIRSAFIELIEDITAAKTKLLTQEVLTEEEKIFVQIPAFFDGIELYHNINKHRDLFNGTQFSQDDFWMTYDITKPETLGSNRLYPLFDKPYIFTRDRLNDYLLDLSNLLKKTDSKCPMLIESTDHTLLLSYEKENDSWLYVDINDFARYPDHPSYFRRLNRAELIDSLFKSFHSASSRVVPFRTIVVSNEKQAIETLQSSFSELNARYPVTSEQALMQNENALGLLHLACNAKDLSTVKILLEESQLDINQEVLPRGITLLAFAVYIGALDIVKELMKRADLDINKLVSGQSPLWFAVLKHDEKMIDEFLQRKDLCINAGDYTAFYLACERNQLDTVKKFLQHPELAVNQLKGGRISPLGVACLNGHLAIIRELLKDSRVDVNQLDNCGAPPFWTACVRYPLEVIQELLKCPGLRVNQTLAEGYTPFYKACEEGRADLVKVLLEHAAYDINQRCKGDTTPLGAACRAGRVSVVEELLRQPNIQINAVDESGCTPFDLACSYRRVNIVIQLCKTGMIDLNKANAQGNTVLHNTCALAKYPTSNDKLFLSTLIDEGADLLCKNMNQETPLDVAIEKNNATAISLISQYIVTKKLSPSLFMSSKSYEKLMTLGIPEVALLKSLESASVVAAILDERLTNTPHFFSDSKENAPEKIESSKLHM